MIFSILISKPIVLDGGGGAEGVAAIAGNKESEYEMTRRSEAEHCIHRFVLSYNDMGCNSFTFRERSCVFFFFFRLLLMSYFPSGFWSRLLTRILADDSVVEIVRSYFIIPEEIAQDPILAKIFVEQKPEWGCWKTGLELR